MGNLLVWSTSLQWTPVYPTLEFGGIERCLGAKCLNTIGNDSALQMMFDHYGDSLSGDCF